MIKTFLKRSYLGVSSNIPSSWNYLVSITVPYTGTYNVTAQVCFVIANAAAKDSGLESGVFLDSTSKAWTASAVVVTTEGAPTYAFSSFNTCFTATAGQVIKLGAYSPYHSGSYYVQALAGETFLTLRYFNDATTF